MHETDRVGKVEEPERFDAVYRVPPGVYDELHSAPGVLRPHWQYLIRALEGLGVRGLEQRRQDARRLLRDNSVTYSIAPDVQGGERPGVLDLLPLLMTSAEWSVVERGLIQRAELFDLMLADLYGPRRLLHSGVLPPELIYSHSGFLYPCDGCYPPTRRALSLYAADLVRAADGNWWVTGDSTQAPSGAGYALENRIILSHVLPSLYREVHVHRLAPFFRALRATLAALAPGQPENPCIALLTTGRGHEAAFEHAYLNNYLGYTLARGSDLLVRDGRVWLKTISGLQAVDVILRRVDDIWCDPLELRADSGLGTPGFLHAARLGQVAIVNPLGSGALENPGLMAFLPGVARYLLGEELRLPSVATWWCGGKKECAYVLANLARLVIKPLNSIGPQPHMAPVWGSLLSVQEREALTQRIRAHPALFVGQEPVALSTTPVLVDNHLEPRPLMLRSFLTAREQTYVVMPGGLARVLPGSDERGVSHQTGGVSKDMWVLASEPPQQISLLAPAGRPLPLNRSGGEIPSREADDLFWLGRSAERTESSARVLREVLLRLLDPDGARYDVAVSALLSAVTHRMVTCVRSVGEGVERRLVVAEPELLAMIIDAERTGSPRFHLNVLTRAGRAVRNRLSDDAARVLNSLDRELIETTSLNEAVESLERIIAGLAAFTGLNGQSMSRGQGFRFLEIGRRLERALHTLNLLRAACELPDEAVTSAWEMILAMTDSLMTYRRRYRAQVEAGATLDLLLHDESSPRSVGYQLVHLQALVVALPRKTPLPYRSVAERVVLQALTALRTVDLDELSQPVWNDRLYETLTQLFAHLSTLLLALSDALSRAYFSHAQAPPQQLHQLY